MLQYVTATKRRNLAVSDNYKAGISRFARGEKKKRLFYQAGILFDLYQGNNRRL